jgi:hypothetical protein
MQSRLAMGDEDHSRNLKNASAKHLPDGDEQPGQAIGQRILLVIVILGALGLGVLMAVFDSPAK